jgi:predicted ATPase
VTVLDRRIGSYTLRSELGTGGMGTVYLAEDEAGSKVALKIVHPHLLASRSFYQRFMREAEIGKLVEHQNVVRTMDVNVATENGEEVHYLLMEYVEGQTLRALLEELGQVPEELCRHIGREISKALEAIHASGAVHRDLKPENVLITEKHVVKVMDLGVARLVDEVIRLSQTGAFAGSVLYAAPEQFRGGEPDPRSDLYSLGLVLYELATGKHPSGGEDFAQTMRKRLNEEARPAADLNPAISPFFEEFLGAILARQPEERIGTAREVVEILEKGEDSGWWEERARTIRARTKQPLRRILIQRETPVHGRDEEIARLGVIFDRIRERQGQVVLVEGEAGIGKTRLVDEFVRRLREDEEEIHFLFGNYPAGGAATAAAAFATAFREQFGREALDRTLQDYLRQTPILIPAFAALLRGEPTPPGVEPLTQESLQTVFVHVTRALAHERPTVLLIDDLQNATEEGRAIFAALSLVAPEHRLMVIGSARPGMPDDWIADIERQDHATRVSLGRLGPKDLARVLIDAFESERLAQELGLQIAQKSDGNPFFVFEIIRSLREGQYITRSDDGSWIKTQVIEQIKIPSSVLDLIQARISDLEEEDRDLVDVASCCGFEFDPLLVASALGMEQIPAMKRFARIEKRHRLIRSSGRRCVFDHHQIQEALYTGMPELLREPYHASLGKALEEREGVGQVAPRDVDGALCVELCNHFFKGGQGQQAMRYLTRALDHLQANYLNDAAVELAGRALAVDGLVKGQERVEILLRKTERLDLLGRREEEREVLNEALRLAEESGDAALRAQVRLRIGAHLGHTADYPHAQDELEQARKLAQEAGDLKLESAAEGQLGNIFYNLGIYASAREHHERTLELARDIGDREEEASASGNLSLILSELGHINDARDHIERVLAIAKETGNRRWTALGRCNLGMLEYQIGDYKEARRHLDKSLMVSHEIGARSGVATAIGNLGLVFRAMGQLHDTSQHFERHILLSREIGSRLGEASALQNLGTLHVFLGDQATARKLLDEALTVSREIGVRRVEGFAIHGQGLLARMRGELDQAVHQFEEALAQLREIGNRRDEAEVLLDLGRVQMSRGARDAARRLIEEARTISRDLSFASGLLLSSAYLAVLDPSRIDVALTTLKSCEARAEHLPVMHARFSLWLATKDRAHLAQAYSLMTKLYRFAPKELKVAMIAKVPWHRDIVTAAKKEEL